MKWQASDSRYGGSFLRWNRFFDRIMDGTERVLWTAIALLIGVLLAYHAAPPLLAWLGAL